MYDSIAMHVFEANNYTCDKEFSLMLSEALLLVVMVSQITTSHQVSDQVYILKVNECVKHVDQESEYNQD